jgi:beta-glucosidase
MGTTIACEIHNFSRLGLYMVYIDRAVASMRACIDDGIDVRGYLHWSLLDNYEWVFGYKQRFGLVAVDRTTFKRTPKPSALHLGALAKASRRRKRST